jgi:hypothetical protein
MFQIANPAGVKRLHVGVMAPDGSYAALSFTAPSTGASLVADAPTEQEMNEMYLLQHDWERRVMEGVGMVYEDPIGGGSYELANALEIQGARDMREELCGAETLELFSPCVDSEHDACSAGYRGMLDGKPHICTCECHQQPLATWS